MIDEFVILDKFLEEFDQDKIFIDADKYFLEQNELFGIMIMLFELNKAEIEEVTEDIEYEEVEPNLLPF